MVQLKLKSQNGTPTLHKHDLKNQQKSIVMIMDKVLIQKITLREAQYYALYQLDPTKQVFSQLSLYANIG